MEESSLRSLLLVVTANACLQVIFLGRWFVKCDGTNTTHQVSKGYELIVSFTHSNDQKVTQRLLRKRSAETDPVLLEPFAALLFSIILCCARFHR
jgi:hypothetical protein